MSGIASTIAAHRFMFVDERELCDGLEDVLTAAGYDVEREVDLPNGRIDFTVELAEDRVGIEVKVAGSPSAVRRQLDRYALYVSDLVLVTTRPSHRVIGPTVGGRLLVPLEVIVVGGGGW